MIFQFLLTSGIRCVILNALINITYGGNKMYTYYCIKAILEDGSVGYYAYGMEFCRDINESSFYDTASEAFEVKRREFDGKQLHVNGLRIVRTTVVEVTSANPI